MSKNNFESDGQSLRDIYSVFYSVLEYVACFNAFLYTFAAIWNHVGNWVDPVCDVIILIIITTLLTFQKDWGHGREKKQQQRCLSIGMRKGTAVSHGNVPCFADLFIDLICLIHGVCVSKIASLNLSEMDMCDDYSCWKALVPAQKHIVL